MWNRITSANVLKTNIYIFVLLGSSEEEVKVRQIFFGKFLREQGKSTFSVNFTWTGPLFNFTLRAYEVSYELTGYSASETIVHGKVVCNRKFSVFF